MLRKFLRIDKKATAGKPLQSYIFAVIISFLAVIIKSNVPGINANAVPVFFLALTLSSIHGGRGPGIVSAAICSTFNLYLFIPPYNSFYITSLEEAIQFIGFTLGAFMISSITGSLYDERERAKIATEKALEYIHQKESFVANVTHEIRTPINAVIGLANLLIDVQGVPAEAKDYIAKIQESSETLLLLVNDILDFSKLDFGKVEIENIDFKLSEKIHQNISLISHVAQNKDLEIFYRIDPALPTYLNGDPSRISQVILNLLSNAVKFTEFGKVELILQLEKQDLETFHIKFEVKDTGVGIASEALDRIFDAFVQEDVSTTRKSGGTGLGLAICKRLVALMGGEIGVKSQLGKGSTFWFTLPLKKGDKDSIESLPARIQSKAANGKRILVVEDHEVNSIIAVKMLEKLGFHVVSAKSGLEAMVTVSTQSYDAILMDCHMPGMDGYETTRRIRETEAGSLRKTPIIALTAYASTENQEKCKSAGMDDYLTKPLRIDQLMSTLTRWMVVPAGYKSLIRSLPATSHVTLDTEHLAMLSEQLGDERGVIDEIISIFLLHTPSRLAGLETSCRNENYIAVQKAVHSLKSASATIGAANMARLCGNLEEICQNCELESTRTAIDTLKLEFSRVKEELAKFRS